MKQESTIKEYFTFIINGESYGVQIESISQITGLQAITRVPGQKRHVKGVMNLRGQIIPVIDLGKRLTGVDVLTDDPSLQYNNRQHGRRSYWDDSRKSFGSYQI